MDESAVELVRDWLTRASHDLRSARILASAETPLLDTAIYHCQQAGEKAVKAFLQSRDDPFGRTHDIEALVAQAAKSEADFIHLARAASILTPYVSAFRYPGGADEPLPSVAEFEEALRLAEEIYNFVLRKLPDATHPAP